MRRDTCRRTHVLGSQQGVKRAKQQLLFKLDKHNICSPPRLFHVNDFESEQRNRQKRLFSERGWRAGALRDRGCYYCSSSSSHHLSRDCSQQLVGGGKDRREGENDAIRLHRACCRFFGGNEMYHYRCRRPKLDERKRKREKRRVSLPEKRNDARDCIFLARVPLSSGRKRKIAAARHGRLEVVES